MRRGAAWLRRAGYGAGCLAWLLVMTLPLAAFVLAVSGEIAWARGEFVKDRLWLIQEADLQGLGFSSTRVVSNEEPVDGPICARTRVIFVLWKGTAEGVQYCECFAAGTHAFAGACEGSSE